MIRCGVAGWDYPNWRGRVYPARRPRGFDALEYISTYFPVVEINRTYYRPATSAEATSWVRRVEWRRDFTFTAKIPEQFTRPGKAWTKAEVREARAGLDVLHEHGRLAAAVVQFAWSFQRTNKDGSLREDALEWLEDVIAAFPRLPLFVEFRHESWDHPEVLARLRQLGVGWVNIDQPRLFHHSLPLTSYATTPTGYLRLHGRNYQTWGRGLGRKSKKTAQNAPPEKINAAERKKREAQKDSRFDYLYPPEEIAEIAAATKKLVRASSVRDVVTINNNHNLGKAPANALMLEAALEHHRVAAPPELVQAFPDELAPVARATTPAALRPSEDAGPLFTGA